MITTPDYINSILKTNSEIHNRSTSFANLNFHCPVKEKHKRRQDLQRANYFKLERTVRGRKEGEKCEIF